MQFAVFLLILISNAEAVQDLSGKVFVFGSKTSTANARLTSMKKNFTALTVCHRSFTDIRRDHALFSMATDASANEFLVYYSFPTDSIQAHVRTEIAGFGGLAYKQNMWHSICTTWDSSSGIVQMWFNGRPQAKKFLSPQLTKTRYPVIILGQDQDSHGGGFDAKQSFEGIMTDVHVWDYVLPSCEIQNYMAKLSFPPGNMIDWAALDFNKNGLVWVHDKQVC